MDDPVDRLIEERQGMDAGYPRSLVLSIVGHLVLVGAAFGAPLLFPTGPVLRVSDFEVVALPRGGGGVPAPAAPPAAKPEPKPSEAPPEPPAPPLNKVLKPPKEVEREGLPELDSKKSRRKTESPPHAIAPPASGRATSASSGAATPGLEFGPPGVGVPDGTDTGGDWYLAGVQQKIWMIWTQQIKVGFPQPVAISFTILADGSVADVRVTQSCGVTMVDLAAQRAVVSAAPFGPLPKDYGTNRKTIQALFKPTT
jgi:TonB family protein